ncbi:phage regulatory CII family protein [Aliivibrio sp. S4TY2]|uniref:Uncharacterized protein n=2 Tax=Aliivibrio TaxID=511678 RepID=A0A5Q4ZS02_9GAMM|nr:MULTISPECIES: phage regulatory CII family protein [Aliivibrio]VVV04462.1 hypothetical protein AW0309160_01857 [Aliivibrio wodanis]MDD9155437.1 phage regulatory CII family protein [Aliivibrio sp. S4TY2]MDD9161564.1 phage regulatory CII family protein [Aliivibrio sp. S4TY1]MDD9165594.1 phage regulatory CII family protein [Aliivibrio sp. S4MY2]MDD9169593.1 phage regulatory CII family protein [Aliivibrio sp. S4MY4]
MYAKTELKQNVLDSAMVRFTAKEDLEKLAGAVGMKGQMLRNKLNGAQPHQLQVIELLKITKASGNKAIIEGVLLELGLTAVELPKLEATNKELTHRVLEVTATTGEITRHTLDINQTNRVTLKTKDAIVEKAQYTINELVLLMAEVEHKFHSIPVLSCAFDIAQSMPSIPSLS